MEYYILALFYSLSGFLMKFSDDAFDERLDKKLAIITGILCGVLIGILAVSNLDAAYIFFAILIGTLLSKKIDGVHHILTLLAFVSITLIMGLPFLSIPTLLICSLGAYLDEIGNDNPDLEKYRFWNFFFKYRFTLKVVIVLLGLGGYIQSLTGLSLPYIDFLSISTIFYFILFEVSYELSGYSFSRIYQGIYNLKPN
ncbi:MAG: hypothetical protein CIT03_01695 [Methanobacterium sp.]|nr:MAG: hypothetical protein CIT03_01695 [Methanobacterium sp.]